MPQWQPQLDSLGWRGWCCFWGSSKWWYPSHPRDRDRVTLIGPLSGTWGPDTHLFPGNHTLLSEHWATHLHRKLVLFPICPGESILAAAVLGGPKFACGVGSLGKQFSREVWPKGLRWLPASRMGAHPLSFCYPGLRRLRALEMFENPYRNNSLRPLKQGPGRLVNLPKVTQLHMPESGWNQAWAGSRTPIPLG